MEFDFLSDISFLIEELIVVGVIGGLAYCINHYRNKSKQTTEFAKKLKALRDEVWQMNRTLIIMATIIDTGTKRLHPNEPHTELEDIAKELLTRAVFEHNNK